jgi:lauroyl/myristoyl acyltransferase
VSIRSVGSWKSWYYGAILPALRRLGPERGDALLGTLGRLTVAGSPARRRAIAGALDRARLVLGAGWEPDKSARAVAANIARFSARDVPLDGLTDAEALARFDVRGAEHLDAALAGGRGAIVVGSHLGAHVAGQHWLLRRGVPIRMLVQRPMHVSRTMHERFDDAGPHPQSAFFLRRAMTPAESADRLLRARSALRDGMAVYLSGDILWPGPNCRAGRLLGVDRTFLAIWADLAALARAPVVFAFAGHRPGGRFALTFDEPRQVEAGGEDAAVAAFLARLEAEIAAHPADAVAYWLWPCFGPPAASVAEANPRIGRRVSVAVGR